MKRAIALNEFVSDFFNPDAALEPAEVHVFSVSELTKMVRSVIEQVFVREVTVEGEISNYRKQSSGHQYFTLKDAQSQLTCVLFARPGAWRRQVPLEDGMQVKVRGRLTVYEARGQYQMTVQQVEPAGAGMLQAKFEALKRKLQAEGLFESSRKRPLPPFPSTIALVTSPSGAALQDMINIFTRRSPWLRLIVVPVRVQGDGSAEEIANAVRAVNGWPEVGLPKVDVIVVGRGGGSAEDLWEFNEEVLARAISASEIPIVSAVGHEIDFTISDFVADLRAPTPSAAAELIAPDGPALSRRLEQLGFRISREVRHQLDRATQRVDLSQEALARGVQNRVAALRIWLAERSAWLRAHRPDQVIQLRRQAILALEKRLADRFAVAFELRRRRLQRLTEHLRILSPLGTLQRGYSITTLADGQLVQNRDAVAPGTRVVTRVVDGDFTSVVE